METKIKKTVCIGGGLIGASWSAMFSKYGYTVCLYDINDAAIENAKKNIDKMFKQYFEAGLITEAEIAEALKRITFSIDLGEAVKDADFIQENVPEKLALKQNVLFEIDKYNSTAIFASSASDLTISEIAKDSKYPERCIGGHPFNPPHLMPIVEIIRSPYTKDEVVLEAKAFYESMKKVPVTLNREIMGFVGNRLQYAFVREALSLVKKGICSVEDVDKVAVYGLGIRWAILGPFLVGELNGGPGGIHDYFANYRTTWDEALKDLENSPDLPEEFIDDLGPNGVAEELAHRTEEEGRSNEDLKAYRDSMLIKILKLHDKI